MEPKGKALNNKSKTLKIFTHFVILFVFVGLSSCQIKTKKSSTEADGKTKATPSTTQGTVPGPVVVTPPDGVSSGAASDAGTGAGSGDSSGSEAGAEGVGATPGLGDIVTPTIITPNADSGRGVKKSEKFGIIFSGGGAKAWAHVAVLKELQKYKLSVVAVAGIEWGAVVAAAYAQSLSVNEVEWELNKFRSLDDWDDFIRQSFQKKSVSGLKVPFVCSSLNLKRQSVYLLNRGMLDQLLPFCLPSAGLIEPFTNGIAALDNTAALVQHLRSNGATKVILVNVLTQSENAVYIESIDEIENQVWQMASQSLKQTRFDDEIQLSLDKYKIDDFRDRREIMLLSDSRQQQKLEQAVQQLAKKYGL